MKAQTDSHLPKTSDWFDSFARTASMWCGKPVIFLLAVAIVVIWGVSGPLFGFSDTWQLVINTGTTIVTFLMVFLIQNTQNRDSLAVQVKLSELIVAMKGAENKLANCEELTEDELEQLHAQYRGYAETLDDERERRAQHKPKADAEEAAHAAPRARRSRG